MYGQLARPSFYKRGSTTHTGLGGEYWGFDPCSIHQSILGSCQVPSFLLPSLVWGGGGRVVGQNIDRCIIGIIFLSPIVACVVLSVSATFIL